MTAPYECEVRAPLADIAAFHRRIAFLGGRVRQRYAFTDHYHQPAAGQWDPHERALRIREHHEPAGSSEVLLTQIQLEHRGGFAFKRSAFPEGKVSLYAGDLAACRAVVAALGFVPWLVVRKRDGVLFEIPEIGELVTEHVDGVGYMVEVEESGEDPDAAAGAIRRTLAALDLPETQVTPQPVAALVAARSGDARERAGAKVYFCGSIRGGRNHQPVYRMIVDHLVSRGFQVLTTHVAAPDVLAQEWREGVTARDIYVRDLGWLAECDLVIAEVSIPSLGVGVEITEAQRLGKPVLALVRQDVQLSAMVGGNPYVRLITYDRGGDLLPQLDEVLGSLPRGIAKEA